MAPSYDVPTVLLDIRPPYFTLHLVCANTKLDMFIIIILYNPFLHPYPHDHPFLYSPLPSVSYSFFLVSIPPYDFSSRRILWVTKSFHLYRSEYVFSFPSFSNDTLGQDGILGWQ